jgi:RNA polymerase sigma factor (sigma-70 family)
MVLIGPSLIMNTPQPNPDTNDDFDRSFLELPEQFLPASDSDETNGSQSLEVNGYWQKLTETRSREHRTDEQLSDEQLMREARCGNKSARSRLIKRMTADLTYCARRYSSFHVDCDIDDLFQVGSLAILKALLHFSTNNFGLFRRYARTAIRRALGKHVQRRAFGLTISARTAVDLRRYKKAKDALTQRLCRQPNTSEIVEQSGLNETDVVSLIEIESRLEVYSLDQLLDEADDEMSQGGLLRASNEMASEDLYSKGEVARLINQMRRDITYTEESVLIGLFGLDDNEPKTLEDIGFDLKMTKQGVARLRDRLLRRLRQQFANQVFEFDH